MSVAKSLIKSAVEHLTGRRTTQSRWDDRWARPEFYAHFPIDEIAHYSVLAGYVKRLQPGGSLLDVGCGAGVFLDHVDPAAFSTYVGVDFPNAIARAQARVDSRTSFVASDLRDFETTLKFDTIMFNEVLYYVDEPVAELVRYSAFLEPDGIFLASLHRKPGSERVWARIGVEFEVIDRVTVANEADVQWIMGAFRPRR